MQRAPRVRSSAALHQRAVTARAPSATARASPRLSSVPLTSPREPLPRPAEIARRHFATDNKGKGKSEHEDDDEEDGIVQQHHITPWTKFVSVPPKPKRVVRSILYACLDKFDISKDDFLEGAKQAFRTLSPFIIYGSPSPALPELRTMMEPELVKRTVRRKPKDDPLIPGFISLVSADILTIDMGIGDPLARVKEAIESGEQVSLAKLQKENLMNLLSVAVRFHTKEEVKSFGGIQQLSPTRFFDMEHIWVFTRRLPSSAKMRELKSIDEKIPNMPWRLARSISFYPAHLQVDLRKGKDDEDNEEEED